MSPSHLLAASAVLLLISVGSLDLSGQSCGCEIPTQTGLQGGQNYKIGATVTVDSLSNLKNGLLAAVSDWQAIEGDNSSLPQITSPPFASRNIIFVDEDQFKTDHPEFASKTFG